jgi:hypothetical protein
MRAFYRWLSGLCAFGYLVTWYLLLDTDITMRWAHSQYEIHEETAMGLSGVVWIPTFIFFVASRTFSIMGVAPNQPLPNHALQRTGWAAALPSVLQH